MEEGRKEKRVSQREPTNPNRRTHRKLSKKSVKAFSRSFTSSS